MKKYGILIISLVIVVGLVFLLVSDQNEERKRAAHIEDLWHQARPYEAEITQIESDLTQRQKAIHARPDYTEIVFSFVPASVEEIVEINRYFEGSGFSPLMILDCSQNEDTLLRMVDACNRGNNEIALAGMTFDTIVIETADQIRQTIQAQNPERHVPFFLRHAGDTQTNRVTLIEHGYDQFVFYSETLSEYGLYQTQYAYVPYIMPRDEETAVDYIGQVPSYRTKVVITLNLMENPISDTGMAKIIDTINNNVRSGNIRYSCLSALYQEIWDDEARIAAEDQAYETYRVAQENRIAELKKIVSEIYSHWDEY